MVWVAICARDDGAALWAHAGLQRRGLTPFELITSDVLGLGVRWEHRLEGGSVSTQMRLPDGRVLSSQDIRGVLNRMPYLSYASLAVIQAADRQYVMHELQAFFLSWLHSLPGPMLNRPAALGLAGQLRHISEWIWLASNAGLRTAPYRQSGGDPPLLWSTDVRVAADGLQQARLFVVDRVVTGAPAPRQIRTACLRLSELSKTALLGIDFKVSAEGEWTFAGVSTHPDLRLGGDPLLDALAAALSSPRGGS